MLLTFEDPPQNIKVGPLSLSLSSYIPAFVRYQWASSDVLPSRFSNADHYLLQPPEIGAAVKRSTGSSGSCL